MYNINVNNNIKIEDSVAYIRVSSTKQAQQGESIEDQTLLAQSTAGMKNLRIVPDNKVFVDVFSGRKQERPVYEELKKYCRTHPNVKKCLIRGIDRFTRGGAVVYETMKKELEDIGVELIDSYGIIQPKQNTLAHLGVEYSWSKYSPSKASELMEAHRGEREVTDILTRMIGAEINLVREGYQIGCPNDGYKNEKVFVENKKKVIQVPDPKRAIFYIKMFEMSATHSDQEVVDYVNAMGFRSKEQKKWSKSKDRVIGHTGGIPLSVKRLQAIRQKPIYCGVNTEKWLPVPIKTQYPGLVSIDCFNKANRGKFYIEEKKDGSIEIYKDYNPHQLKRTKENPLFPFKDVVLCPICNKPFLGSTSKNKKKNGYSFYHCSRNHKYLGFNKKDFEEKLTKFVSGLKYKDERFFKALEVTLINKYREKEKELGEFSVKVGTTVIELETEKRQKIEAYTSTKNEIIRSELEKQINDLHQQIEKTRENRNNIEIQENDVHSFVKYVRKLMEHPVEMLVKQDNIQVLKGLYS